MSGAKMFPETMRLMWYAVCVPDPEDASKNFIIGYDNERHQTGYGYAENLIFDFYRTKEYEELRKEYPNITCHTRARSDPRLWTKVVGVRPDQVWEICQFTGKSPSKVLSALLHRNLYRTQRDAQAALDEERCDEDEVVTTPLDWLDERGAAKCATDVLSQAMWSWYGFPESRRRTAVDRDTEYEDFEWCIRERRTQSRITAMYLFPNVERKEYVGYVDKEPKGEDEE